MSMIRPITCLAALLAVTLLADTASAQRYQPFIEPGYFEPDFQFFAPAEAGEFGGGEPPNTGIYASYDRTYVNMTRPDGEASLFSEFDGDFTWGNRFEIGYMTEDDTGWGIVHWHLSGPNEYVANAQDTNYANVTSGMDIVRIGFSEDISQDSLNVASLSSFELNKTWRRKEFHNGAILEPLAGFRYMNFRDFYRRTQFTAETITITFDQFRTIDFERAVFENAMYGGQLGGRLFWTRAHWTLSTDVRFFACYNQQTLLNETVNATEFIPADLETIGEVVGPDVIRDRSYRQRSMFVWGGEVRAEAAYELTRDISLRFGMVFFDLGQGIGRGNTLQDNNQDVQLAGVTFGFTINR